MLPTYFLTALPSFLFDIHMRTSWVPQDISKLALLMVKTGEVRFRLRFIQKGTSADAMCVTS